MAKSPNQSVVRLNNKMSAINNNNPEKEPFMSDLLNEMELPMAKSK